MKARRLLTSVTLLALLPFGMPAAAQEPPAPAPIAKIQGPREVRAENSFLLTTAGSVGKTRKWIVNPPLPETATFTELMDKSGNDVVLVSLPAAGQYWFNLCVSEGAAIDAATWPVLAKGVGPQPIPPGPDPKPPEPTPPIPPSPAKSCRVLMLYESGELSKYPATQFSVLHSRTVRDYLTKKCPLGPDGKTSEWRVFDQDVDTSGESATWQELMKTPRQSLPWLVIQGDGKVVYSDKLPLTVDETMAVLKRYCGE